ncbi:beta strand repeat-containing protein, partial [Poseidonibacter sp.]|uniref:beta strand repeat-containing protein n=1 Tax=Poseidonibacter sp. TaxID=2321188 RepID=UPI003C71003D
GNDTLFASNGNDTLIGNTGNDTVDYSSRNESIEVTLNQNQFVDLKEAGINKDKILGIEKVIGSTVNDTIIGDSESNILNGKAGNDTLLGEAGNDSLLGEEGDDTLSGGKGNDYIDGGENSEINGDTVDYSYLNNDSLGVNVNLSNKTAIDLNNNNTDIVRNIENVIGTNNNDIIIGDEFNNTLDGKAGNDTLKGGAGDDHFLGGDGIDTVDYSDVSEKLNIDLKSLTPTEVAIGQGVDTFDSIEGVIGGTNDDTLVGTNSANNIFAQEGNDTLIGYGGNDTLDGGDGKDLVSFGFTTNDISLDLSKGNSTQTSGVGTLVVTNVEDVIGGFGNDTLTGTDEANTLSGGFGNDTLISKGGNDTLDGGKNSDSYKLNITNTSSTVSITIGTLIITALSASADDMINTLISDFNSQNISGEFGTLIKNGTELLLQTDKTVSFSTNVSNTTSSFIDVVDYSSLSNDFISVDLSKSTEQVSVSDNSKDTLIDIEKIIATNQSDTIIADANNNILIGKAGDDNLFGGAGADTIEGGDGNDIINGGDDSDKLSGDAGNDTFISTVNDGIDYIDGGSNSDTVDYSLETNNIEVNLNGSIQSRVKINNIDNDYIENIENIISGSGNDKLTGDDNDNTFYSNSGDDTLVGGKGNDYLDAGSNTSIGDTVDYSYIDTSSNIKGVNVNLQNQIASDRTDGDQVGTDTLINIENVNGTKVDDLIIGNSEANTLYGNAGNDTLEGNAGNDSLLGGDGDDILKGGSGNDVLNGGAGNDTADFSDATSSINVDLSATEGNAVPINAELGTDTFISIEGVIGGSNDDTIKGTSDANSLLGGAGNDLILGGGTDTSSANEYDYIDGGTGIDTVSYDYIKDESKSVTINLGLDYNGDGHTFNDADFDVDQYQNAGEAGKLFIQNVENLEGGAGNDILIGNEQSNILTGGVGNDTLIGGSNSNTLIGGEAKDSDSLTIDENNSDALAGLGIDTVDYSGITNSVGISADMNSGIQVDTNSIQVGEVSYNINSVDNLYGIENIRASKNNDNIIGDLDDNVVN